MIMSKEAREVTRNDIIPLKQYSKNRKQLRKDITEFKKHRRISLGPCATFYFECYETMLAQIQEIDGGVTVHHACHARAQYIGNKARDMLKLIPNIKLDLVEKCSGHGGTFGVMQKTHDIARKFGKLTASIVAKKQNKYMVSDCPLAGKHLQQLKYDKNITNDEAIHPIEILAKAYRLV